jgi:hypothetical protein
MKRGLPLLGSWVLPLGFSDFLLCFEGFALPAGKAAWRLTSRTGGTALHDFQKPNNQTSNNQGRFNGQVVLTCLCCDLRGFTVGRKVSIVPS